MIKPFVRPCVHGKGLLPGTYPSSEYGSEEQTEFVTVHLATIVKNMHEPRFSQANMPSTMEFSPKVEYNQYSLTLFPRVQTSLATAMF